MSETRDEIPVDSTKTNCVVVGGGPAGVVLAYLLGRAGVPVTLLESNADFDRDYRGDTMKRSRLNPRLASVGRPRPAIRRGG